MLNFSHFPRGYPNSHPSNVFCLQGLDAIAAILDLNFSRVLMMMDVSPASVTSMAQWTNSAIHFLGSVSAREKPKDLLVTLAEKTSMGWPAVLARPVTVVWLAPRLGPRVTRRQGSVSVSPMLEGDSAISVWRGTSACSRVPSSVCLATARRPGQSVALCCVTSQVGSVFANQE